MNDRQFQQLLEYLQLSWSGYRRVKKGVKKRVRRHMRALGCDSMQEYIERLNRHVESKNECELLMSVSISRFFRDRKLWEILREQVLPEIVATGKNKIKVWSAGCACGEEVYSLKIVWELMRRAEGRLPALEIIATDLNPSNLQRARDGTYPPSSLKEIPKDVRASFFQAQRGGKRFGIDPTLKSGISWLERDIFAAPPGSGYQLIFVRNNLLTYFQPQRAEPAVNSLISALCPDGFLVTGSREKHPLESATLKSIALLPCVSQKRQS